MNRGIITLLIAGLIQTGCAHVQSPPRVESLPPVPRVETPEPPLVVINADPVVPSIPPNPVVAPLEPALASSVRDADVTVFRADAPTRVEAVNQVTKAVRRYLQSELDQLAQREATWCRDNLTFARDQLFFSQLSLAPVELGGNVLVEEWLTVDTQLPGGHQLVARLPKSLPVRLLREHLRGLESYVAASDRAAFRERFPNP